MTTLPPDLEALAAALGYRRPFRPGQWETLPRGLGIHYRPDLSDETVVITTATFTGGDYVGREAIRLSVEDELFAGPGALIPPADARRLAATLVALADQIDLHPYGESDER